MITREQANNAKIAVMSLLGRPAWLRGVGIGQDAAGQYAVKVNVQAKTAEVLAAIPASMGEVSIVIDEVGDIRAFKA